MAEPPQAPVDAEAGIDWKAVHALARRILLSRMRGFPIEDIEDAAQKTCKDCLLFVRKYGAPRSIDGIVNVIAACTAADEIKRRVRDRKLVVAELVDALHPQQDGDLYDAIETTVFLIRGYYLLRHAPCVELLDVRLGGGTFEAHARTHDLNSAQVRQRWERCMGKVREAVRRGRLRIPLEFPISTRRT